MSCQSCRKGKVRCDEVKPSCTRCARLYKACIYEPSTHRKVLGRLQDRIQALEQEIESLNRNKSAFLTPGGAILSSPVLDPSATYHPGTDSLPALHLLPFFPYSIWNTIEPSHIVEGESYSSAIPRFLVEHEFSQWDRGSVVTPRLSEYLIRLFLPFRNQYNFYMDIIGFLDGLRQPIDDVHRPSEALITVVHLIACRVAHFPNFERLFLSRARQALSESLAHVIKITHFVAGSLLLMTYQSRLGNLVEAASISSSTVRFAIACGFHLSASAPQDMGSIDPTERERQGRLWKNIYFADGGLSWWTGLPMSVPEECKACVTQTNRSWPASLTLVPFPPRLKQCHELLWDASNDSSLELKLRCICLFNAIRELAGIAKDKTYSPDSTRWVYRTLMQYLDEYERTYPPLNSRCDLLPDEHVGLISPGPFSVRIILYTAAIALYSIPIDSGDALDVSEEDKKLACQKRLEAAYGIVEALHIVCGQSRLAPIHADIITMTHAYSAAEVVLREITSLSAYSSRDATQETCLDRANAGFRRIADYLIQLTAHYPAWKSCIRGLLDVADVLPSPAN